MSNNIPVGIDALSFYCPYYFLDLKSLAENRGIDVGSYYKGIGQEKMAVPPPGEDIITMAANAARKVVSDREIQAISTLIFATESGIDQSKSGGIYVHKLLGLSPRCRVFEVKQACYGATAALQMAIPLVRQNPNQSVLIIASDIARYGLGTAGEQTQGGGAVAMLITSEPKLMVIDEETGLYTEDVMDFWRPNYRDEALVDGRSSIRAYIRALLDTWQQYQSKTERDLAYFDRFCYHLPFTRMANKAHEKLVSTFGTSISDHQLQDQISDTQYYNRIIGNTYAASLYISLACLLDRSSIDLAEKKVGLFSYGSGCVAEFYSGQIVPGYKRYIFKDRHSQMLNRRCEISYDEYKRYYNFSLPADGREFTIPHFETGDFRLSAIKDHKRIYQEVKHPLQFKVSEEKICAGQF